MIASPVLRWRQLRQPQISPVAAKNRATTAPWITNIRPRRQEKLKEAGDQADPPEEGPRPRVTPAR